MNILGKIVGFFMLFLVGIPFLGVSIWAVGVTQGALSEAFLTEVPKALIEKTPAVSDEIYEAMLQASKDPKNMPDSNARAWLQAAERVGVKPSALLADTGVSAWMEEELGQTLTDLSAALRGEKDPKEVKINFLALKQALASPVIQEFFEDTLAQLPSCDEVQMALWKRASTTLDNQKAVHYLPACNPDVEILPGATNLLVSRLVDVPDEVRPLEDSRIPQGIDVFKMLFGTAWLLLLGPAFVLAAGAAMLGGRMRGFLVWLGGATMLGGLIPLLTSSLIRTATLAALEMDPTTWQGHRQLPWLSQRTTEILIKHLGEVAGTAVDTLFSPVTTIALVTVAVGAVLVIVSFFAGGKARD